MSAIITVSNSDGVVGQCDAKCYDARADYCECICAGLNHGAGREAAQHNTASSFRPHLCLSLFAQRQGLNYDALQVNAHSDLFPYGNEPTTVEIKRNLRRAKRQGSSAAHAMGLGTIRNEQ